MKKKIYISGMICLAIILLATIFKMLHFPGAGILLTVALGSITLIFLPLAYFKLMKSTEDKLLKFVFTAAFISFFIDFIGVLFKIMHWPGAGWFMIIGVLLPFILFLPAYIIYHSKRKLKSNSSFFSIVLFMIYLGVFSTLLAQNVNYNILSAYAHATNTISESNRYLILEAKEKNESQISVSSMQIVKQIEDIKHKLVLAKSADNEEVLQLNESFNYDQVEGMETKISFQYFNEIGFIKLNQQFEEFKKELKTIKMDSNSNRLIQEIDAFRVPKYEDDYPLIAQLPLIAVLNELSNWQNKLLLINYIYSTQAEHIKA